MIAISVKANIAGVAKGLDDLAKRQLPFASALAVTGLAQRVRLAETANLAQTFDRPTPFTLNAVGVVPARKANPTAIVFVRDRQAAYLAPYEFGGRQVLGSKRALLNPKRVPLNQYGNIARGKLKQLKGRRDVFVGTMKGVSGVWQRLPGDRLKLLIRWGEGIAVRQHLGYVARAQAIVDRFFAEEFAFALRRALATAR
jgi:hypothetical protein